MFDAVDGFRKIIVSIIILAVGIGVALHMGDIPDNLLQLLSIIFGGFIVGNVGEHISGAVVSKAEALAGKTTTPTPDISKDIEYVSQQVAGMEAKVSAGVEATAAVQAALAMIIQKYGMDK